MTSAKSQIVGRAVGGLAVLGVVVLFAVYASRATAGEAVRGDVSGFRLIVATDQAAYDSGDPVQLAVTVCRSASTPVTTSSGGGTSVLHTFRVLDASGQVVADTTHAVSTLELRAVLWLPGMCRTVHNEWDQHRWNREDPSKARRELFGVPVRGDRTAPGSYTFEVQWHTAPWDAAPRPQPPITSPPFELAP